MSAPTRCPRCDSALPAGAPAGLCPLCLLREGLEWDPSHDGATTRPSSGPRRYPSLADSLGIDPVVLLDDDRTDPAPVTLPGSTEAPARDSERYQILGEIARGGMGAVLKGRDPDLGRDLAVKVLLGAHRDRPAMVRRFVEEAQIGGQLQHPGIVPVYELGVFPDRRPYFTMKLVRGRTLAALLDDRPDPGHDRPRFLAIFEQVAQTVAYAHAHRAIHRDLKPSNVMVGSFGEVQVMDWGLAKVLAEGGVADEEEPEWEVRTTRSGSDADASRAGSVLGTPSYMAPEQARGEVGRLDERADVFALGAILCDVLTGRPPFAAASRQEAIARASAGDTTEALAALAESGADAELLDLARRCLAADPAGRPRDAREVAGATTAYLAGVQERLRSAELARVEAQARAEEVRKRQRVERRLSMAVLAVLAAGVVGVATQWGRAERNLAEAKRASEGARRRLDLALEAIDNYTTGVGEDLHLREPGLDPLRRRLLVSALTFAQRLQGALEADPQEAASPELAAAYERVSDITNKTGDRAAAVTARERALAIRERLAAAPGAAPEALAEAAADRHHLGLLLMGSGRPADGLRLVERARADYEGLVRARPGSAPYRHELAETDNSLATLFERLGRRSDAIAALERSAAAFDRLAAADPNPAETRHEEGLGRALMNLSIQSDGTNRPERALDFARRAVDTFEQAARRRPDDGRIRSFLARSQFVHGGMLDGVGRGEDALRAYLRAVELYTALLREFPNNLALRNGTARAHDSLGVHYANVEHRWDAALEEYRKSLPVYEGLARDNPQIVDFAFNEAQAHLNIGAVFRRTGRPAEALPELRKGSAVFERLAREQPADPEARRELARAEVHVGAASVATGDLPGAAAAYRRGAEMYASLPTPSADNLYNLACCHARLAMPGMPAGPGPDQAPAAHRDRALAALRRAVAAGFRDLTVLRTDTDLDPLRDRPEFRTLLLDAAFPADPFAR